jgi:hypothetical protein
MTTYDSKRVIVAITCPGLGSHVATQFVEGSRVDVVKDGDAITMTKNSDGGGVFNVTHDESGTITLHMQQTSPTNDYLSSVLSLQRLTGGGECSVMVKDVNGRSLHHAPSARLQKAPDAAYASESGEREWVFLCLEINDFIGGVN